MPRRSYDPTKQCRKYAQYQRRPGFGQLCRKWVDSPFTIVPHKSVVRLSLYRIAPPSNNSAPFVPSRGRYCRILSVRDEERVSASVLTVLAVLVRVLRAIMLGKTRPCWPSLTMPFRAKTRSCSGAWTDNAFIGRRVESSPKIAVVDQELFLLDMVHLVFEVGEVLVTFEGLEFAKLPPKMFNDPLSSWKIIVSRRAVGG